MYLVKIEMPINRWLLELNMLVLAFLKCFNLKWVKSKLGSYAIGSILNLYFIVQLQT